MKLNVKRTDAEWLDLFNTFHKDGMLNFVLGALISSDNDMTEEDIRTRYEYMHKFSSLVDKIEMSDKERERIARYISDGLNIIENDAKEHNVKLSR